ncbi:MAG TPA: PAS domain-containing sensor histidine kinase [Methanocellaceae archaeon]
MKQILQELVELGDFAARAIEDDTVSFIAIYEDGRILTCNHSFCRLTGYTKDEISLMKWPDDFTPAAMLKRITGIMAELSCNETQVPDHSQRYNKEIVRKNGSAVPIEIYMHKFCSMNGNPQYYYAFITDITDQVNIEQGLKRSRDQLEELVAERTGEMIRANDALIRENAERKHTEEALRDAIGQADLYVDLMSHDLSNMNHAIMGYLELALETLEPVGNDRALLERPLEIIRSSAQLIENVKKLRKLRSNNVQYAPEDLGTLISEVINKHRDTPERDITINYVPVHGLLVNSNGFLKDVFANVVDNAIKHSEGPLTVNIDVAKASKDAGEYYRIMIEDTGPGIPDMLKGTIFNFINDNSGKANRRGLGLHLVKTIVGLLNGNIWVEDRVPGDSTKGARFVIMLPAICL